MQEILRISTADIPVGQKHRFWSAQVMSHIAKLEIDINGNRQFNGSFSLRTLGPTKVALVEAEYQSIVHHADASDDRVELIYVETGFLDISRFNRHVTIGNGQWCVLDDREDYAFTTSDKTSSIVLQMPGQWVRRFLPELGEDIVSSVGCVPNWERALAYAIKAIGSPQQVNSALDDLHVVEHVGGLLSLALGHLKPTASHHKATIMRSIRRIMVDRFADCELSAADVAAKSGISRRYLHQLFAEQGESFGKQLLKLRLHKAQQMLNDPRFVKTSIAEISHTVGFADSAHFARQFKIHHGVNPAEYRRRQLRVG